MSWIPEPQPKPNSALAWIALSIAIVAVVVGVIALLAGLGLLSPTLSDADLTATAQAENAALVAQLQPTVDALQQSIQSAPPPVDSSAISNAVVAQVMQQLALTPAVDTSAIANIVATQVFDQLTQNAPVPVATTPAPNLQGVILTHNDGGANFTVRLRPASVLNEKNDTSLSKSADGQTDIKSRCYPLEFDSKLKFDDTKAIPFELVFEGEGTFSADIVAEITLAILGDFITVKRGIDGNCIEATQYTNTATIELGISNAIPQ
ncbi:MAG: hypothetical protein ACOYLB_17620, partial [Phototrophicaceae bacterium]